MFDEVTQFLVSVQCDIESFLNNCSWCPPRKSKTILIWYNYACTFVLSFNAWAQFYVFCLFFFEFFRNFVYLADCAFKSSPDVGVFIMYTPSLLPVAPFCGGFSRIKGTFQSIFPLSFFFSSTACRRLCWYHGFP